MHAVAAAEATTTIGGLELGGAKAAVPENKRGASKIASLRAAADLDGAADGGEEPCPASTSSSSHPADPTLETCCHEPPPIALNPLNSWLFFGEKALRLPIPPTNDIVVSLLIFGLSVFFRSVRAPRGKKNKCESSRGRWVPATFRLSCPSRAGLDDVETALEGSVARESPRFTLDECPRENSKWGSSLSLCALRPRVLRFSREAGPPLH
jgi:hypothetical protein